MVAKSQKPPKSALKITGIDRQIFKKIFNSTVFSKKTISIANDINLTKNEDLSVIIDESFCNWIIFQKKKKINFKRFKCQTLKKILFIFYLKVLFLFFFRVFNSIFYQEFGQIYSSSFDFERVSMFDTHFELKYLENSINKVKVFL